MRWWSPRKCEWCTTGHMASMPTAMSAYGTRYSCPELENWNHYCRKGRKLDAWEIAIVGDAHKAHRRIKVREEDWGFMGCRLVPGKVWINKVGTYGFSSAGYFWSRFGAAVLVRMIHYFIGARWSPEVLLYADDLMMLAGGAKELRDLGIVMLIFEALGVPMKWKKYRGVLSLGG